VEVAEGEQRADQLHASDIVEQGDGAINLPLGAAQVPGTPQP
jgi:hypothetical protein